LFDQDLTLDMAITSATLSDVTTYFGAETVKVVVGSYSLGNYPLTIENPPDGPYTVGFDYTTRIEPMPPSIEDNEGSIVGQYMRITDCYVSVISSARFAQEGYALAAYQVTDDFSVAPPLRTGPQRFQFQGWEQEPTIPITQPDPLPLTVLAMKSVVVY
jgi:hypothetical protein